ncbi:MAG: DJ-1/PfpI family protein, partial [Parcubacteria group bacterium]|nr:DJ-1/PfpI family protein [Parcubacteria group bacterium]
GSGAMKDLDNKDVYKIAQQAIDKDKLVGAICIASAILANAGVLKGKKATVWSSNMDKSAVKLLEKGGADYKEDAVVIDGKIITANGPEQARRFAETMLSMLK